MSMTASIYAPGVEFSARATQAPRPFPTQTGVAFIAGTAQKGPANTPIEVNNMAGFEKSFGVRQSNSVLWDSVERAIARGASRVFVARTVGPAASLATRSLNNGATPVIGVDAIGPGTSTLTVEAIAGAAAGTRRLVIRDGTTEVERSIDLASNAEAQVWALSSKYVRVRVLNALLFDVTAVGALAGGSDDFAGITDVHRAATIESFRRSLGPGQVLYPGATTTVMHVALLNHAKNNVRWALLDLPDGTVRGTLETAVASIIASGTLEVGAHTYGMIAGDRWLVFKGLTPNTRRVVPPSAVTAGIIAASDGARSNPNRAAAGPVGGVPDAIEISGITEWTYADRVALNNRGVNTWRYVNGQITLYGYRSLDETPAWRSAGAGRLRMAIQAEAEALGEGFAFAQLDPLTIGQYNGALRGILGRWYNKGALFGDTAEEAFAVNTGPTVNTADTLANDELRSVLAIRTTPMAERVIIELVKVAVTETIAA